MNRSASIEKPFFSSTLNTCLSFVRILFIDFSSAFNTIQPHALAHKLTQAGVNAKLVLWIVNFLIERTQKVHFQNSYFLFDNHFHWLSAKHSTATFFVHAVY